MIQRSLLGKSRSLCSRSQYIPIVSPIRSHIPPIRIRPLQERISSRYYSSTDTSKDGPSPDGAATGNLQSEIEDTDPIKKDIEVKDKEIIELKVGPKLKPSVIRPRNLIYLINIGQVSSLGSRLSQPSRTHEARCSIRSRLRHLPLRLGPS